MTGDAPRRPTAPGPAVPDRRAADRAAWATFAIFVLNGLVFASWVSRLPAVRDALGLSPARLGVLLLVGSLGSVIALPLTGAVVQRLGTARTVVAAAVLNVTAFAVVAVAVGTGQVALLAPALFLAQIGIAAWDVAMNLQGTVVEQALGRAIMPRFHAGFSLGTVLGAGVGAVAAYGGVSVTAHLLAMLALILVGVLLGVRGFLPGGQAPAGEGRRHGLRTALSAWGEGRTLLIGLVVLAAALTEGAANDWLALAVVDGFEQTDAVGAAAFGLFVTTMTVMRLLGTGLLERYGRVVVLRLCSALALGGLLLFGLAPNLWLALVGAGLWGLGAALGFPVGMSAASDDPLRAAARVSVVSSIGYTAFLAGPPLLGLLAEHVGYRHALLAIVVPLVLSLLLVPAARPLGAGGQAPGRAGARRRS
ncbi:MFS transporter [Georgenia sp. TF02-10]|uniref:MFS transporter n=1 Tax=Georgenia sp. TF02-10 TaxID=2917725 RepID=UPI001FA7ADA2|nr:MFS transporter [Georgenia sp. TF02-10]UNX54390.1 MFS transporter [Georgenia sp. TF02-10]